MAEGGAGTDGVGGNAAGVPTTVVGPGACGVCADASVAVFAGSCGDTTVGDGAVAIGEAVPGGVAAEAGRDGLGPGGVPDAAVGAPTPSPGKRFGTVWPATAVVPAREVGDMIVPDAPDSVATVGVAGPGELARAGDAIPSTLPRVGVTQ